MNEEITWILAILSSGNLYKKVLDHTCKFNLTNHNNTMQTWMEFGWPRDQINI